MKEEKEKQFRKDSELELSKERKEVRDGRSGLSKDAENKRRLSKAEEKRRTVFEMKKKEFLSQGWHTADLTVGMVYANVMTADLSLSAHPLSAPPVLRTGIRRCELARRRFCLDLPVLSAADFCS